MTTSPPSLTSDSYTPLELLLLFQSLQAYGVDHAAFPKISEALQNNPVIRDAPAFDPVRLRPAALEDVYLGLLKEEVRRDAQQTSPEEVDNRNGEGNLGSRKRKAPSPRLPSVQEAAQYVHLVPLLVAKSYAGYQEQIIREIREEEHRYATLQGEIKEIENGTWKDRIGGRDVPPVENPLDAPRQGKDAAETPPNPVTAEPLATGATIEQPSRAEQDKTRQSSRGATSIDALINHPIAALDIQPANSSPYPHANSPNVISTNAALPYAPSSHHRLPSQPFPNSPRLSAPLPPRAGSGLAPSLQLSPHGSNHPQPVFTSSPALQSRHVAPELPSASSRILPPPRGMQISTLNGVALTPAQFRPPQHRAPSVPSPPLPYNPQSERYAMTRHAPQRGIQSPLPTTRGQLPPQQNYYVHPGRTPYPPYAPPSHPPRPPPYYPSRQGGIMLPPFQVTPQEPNRASQQSLQHASIATQTRTPVRAPQPAEGATAPLPSPTRQVQQPVPSDLRKSIPTLHENRPPPKPLRLTVYKSQSHSPARNRPETPDERPDPEAVSPQLLPTEILRPLSPELLGPPPSNGASAVRHAAEAPAAAGGSPQAAPEIGVRRDTDAGPTAGGRRRIGRRRKGSIAASGTTSPAGGRTRSQSLVIGVEAPFVDHDMPSGREVKPEPSTPAPVLEDAETARVRESSTVRGTGEMTQLGKRKRKREQGPLDTLDASEAPGSIPPATTNRQYILCSRNFHKMSQPIMHDIQSHKHGSLFSNPVKEKDAQGYTDIIRRPQDLKSIRTAIAAGGRAVAAAASDTPQGSPGSVAGRTGGNVLLPIGPDLVPPKGIVNSAQLEKELMRMFANAIMFNPGDEGVVQDAREMFRTNVRTVESWRSAERPQSGRWEDEGDELGAEESVVEEGARKRRRA